MRNRQLHRWGLVDGKGAPFPNREFRSDQELIAWSERRTTGSLIPIVAGRSTEKGFSDERQAVPDERPLVETTNDR